jgi:ribonucleoside-diphosphate reductase beta chain
VGCFSLTGEQPIIYNINIRQRGGNKVESKKVQAKAIWNPDVKTDSENRMLINGDTSNMMILSNNKYPWSYKMYDLYMGNFWKPESIGLKADNEQYSALPPNEMEAFDNIISFLVFLDSLQTVNLPNINGYVTLPEINLLLIIQTYQEAIHSQSYGYVLESVVPPEKRSKIYDLALTSPFMLKRNKFIADLYQEFVDNESEIGFVYVAMANYILEGIYFYAGFSFFYNLARQGKMTGVATEIKYINRDEISHLALFQGIFR